MISFKTRREAIRAAVTCSLIERKSHWVVARERNTDDWLVGEWIPKGPAKGYSHNGPFPNWRAARGDKFLVLIAGKLIKRNLDAEDGCAVCVKGKWTKLTVEQFQQENENVRKAMQETKENPQPTEDCGEQETQD